MPLKNHLNLIACPLGYCCLASMVGSWLARSVPLSAGLLLILLVGLLIAASYQYFRRADRTVTILLLIGFNLVGALLYAIERDRNQAAAAVIARLTPADQTVMPLEIFGRLSGPVLIAPDRAYLSLESELLRNRERIEPARLNLKITIWLADPAARAQLRALALTPGATLHVIALARFKPQFQNPGGDQTIAPTGFDLTGSARADQIELLARGSTPWWFNISEPAREYLQTRIDAQFSPAIGGLLKAALLGNGYFLAPEIADQFRAAGLYHILIISGSHIALLAILINWWLGFCTTRRWLRALISIALLAGYGLLVGGDWPVVRAVLMTALGIAAWLFDRDHRPVNSLALAGLLMLAVHPGALFEAGFQLTFTAVAAILLIALPLIERLSAIGNWRLSVATPYPPRAPAWLRWCAELLYWSEQEFIREQQESPTRYRLEKNRLAVWLERYHLQRPLRAIVVMLITSTIVQLVILPLSICYFNRVALIGIVLNVAAELMLSLLLLVFLIFIVVDAISLTAGAVMAQLVELVARLFIATAAPIQWLNIWPNRTISLLSFRAANYHGWRAGIYLLYLLPVLSGSIKLLGWRVFAAPGNRARNWCANSIWLVCYLLLLTAALFPARLIERCNYRSGYLTIAFLDVGQGDAALVTFPGGSTMMIDSGGAIHGHKVTESFDQSTTESATQQIASQAVSIGEQVDSRYLWHQGITQLDYILITHAHSDHIEGFRDVVKNFPIGQAIVPTAPTDDPEYQRFIATLQAAGVPISHWSRGQHYQIEGVEIEVLWPPASPAPPLSGNDQSLVLRLQYRQQSFLLVGDIEHGVEAILVGNDDRLASSVLKVPHHGSRTSSSEAFLSKVAPAVAIISAPVNSRFNHPHREVVARYRDHQTVLFQTGRVGTVTISTDGDQLQIGQFANH